ncbi:MAG: response regulator [Proteobacteria bacterium]|nr:response regulator [Pseudomonadota bacterium]
MILLVEDDEDVREMLKLTLEVNGCVVELASDGRAALAAMTRQRPCLVILDLVMPVMSGWEVLAQMQARQLDDIPVCVISALGGPTPSEAIASLCKPFETSELLAVTDRYCAHGTRPPRRKAPTAAPTGSG